MSQRLDKDRYALEGAWRCADSWVDAFGATITVDVCDIRELRASFVWRNGAYRVRIAGIPGFKSKTFYGEMAWADATRYASDAATKAGDWRWHPNL
jgi:hypothetical protein